MTPTIPNPSFERTEPGSAVARLRAALEEHGCQPRGSNVRFRSRCPAHESRGLTLAVSQGRRGAAAKCHAQCETSEILAALSLDWGDLFDQPPERRPDWRPRRPPPPDDPMAELKRVFTRAVDIINLRSAIDTYRERCPMPSPSVVERIELAIWAEQRDADAHYWHVTSRRAVLATDERYVRQAHTARATWLRTGRYEDRPAHEQDAVLALRAEDLERAR